MRGVVQRVSRARVSVGGQVVGEIAAGICVLVAAMNEDRPVDAELLAKKVTQLRIFCDESAKMNLAVGEVQGAVLAVSQFTLAGDVRTGNRPSFSSALQPEPARELFDYFCECVRTSGLRVETGQFRTHMEVELVNDGPVTILLDTKRVF